MKILDLEVVNAMIRSTATTVVANGIESMLERVIRLRALHLSQLRRNPVVVRCDGRAPRNRQETSVPPWSETSFNAK
jgi:hypothetical protein